MRKTAYLLMFAIIALALAACSGAADATLLPEPTQAAVDEPVVTDAPATEVQLPVGAYVPLKETECTVLAGAVSQVVGVAGEQAVVPFIDQMLGEQGSGCETRIITTAEVIDSWSQTLEDVMAVLATLGWQQDQQHMAMGPTGQMVGMIQDNKLCFLWSEWKPADDVECPEDQPIGACDMPPEKKIHTVSLNCALNTTTDITVDQPLQPVQTAMEEQRVQFDPGTTSATLLGTASGGFIDRYIVYAMEGQQMTVTLTFPEADTASPRAIFAIWGADGTVLISDHADATSWTGVLPATQDYNVDVRGLPDMEVDYILEVSIPPLGSSSVQDGPEFHLLDVLPLDIPVGYVHLMGLSSPALPIILPPEIPSEEGLPEILPFVMLAEPDEYEIYLGYGSDCAGAAACHYGTLAGKQVSGNALVDTASFMVDMEKAIAVQLQKGISGYFFLGECGASCDDSRVVWLFSGIQYITGIKGAPMADVVALANATILNSMH